MDHRPEFLRFCAQTSPAPLLLEITHARGTWLYSPDGTRYLDLVSGISVSNLGHAVPEVIQAIKDQSSQYLHVMVYGEMVLSPQALLARDLCTATGHDFDNVYFVNSGSEAIEGALKLAKRFTGKPGIVSLFDAYHGGTHGALSLNGGSFIREGFGPLLPSVAHMRPGSWEDLSLIQEDVAAVVLELLQGEAGARLLEPDWVKAVASRCREMGALLIFDEIQTGMGRTGSLFLYQETGVIPDILVLGKALGAGMPMGAFMARKEVMHVLSHDPVLGHITTFGGHALVCAAARAGLKVLAESAVIDTVIEKERYFRTLLGNHPAVRRISGKGLLLAVHLDSAEAVQAVIGYCLKHGVLTDWFLHCADAIRIAPPLIISEAEIRLACEVILQGLDAFSRRA